MMPDLLAILLAFAAVAFAPGPANLAVALVAASEGWRRAVPMALGLASGLAIWGVLAALGLGAVLAASEGALMVLRLSGGAYLLWLAWKAGRSSFSRDAVQERIAGGRFRDGLLLNLSNPKAVFAWLAALSMGLGPSDGAGMLALATGLCMVIGLANYLAWSFVFSRGGAKRVYAAGRRWIDGACAAMFAAAGLGLLRQALVR